DAPRVRVRVTSLERFVAPPPEPDLAVRVDGVALPARIIAGVGAGFDVTLARRGVALLAIEHDGGELLRQLALDPTSPTPARVGARIVVRGRVNDGRQRPVRGARVWFGELHADGSERSFVVDDEGAFEADVPAGDGVPFVVRATGYASKWRAISVGPDVQPLDEVLQPATTVYLQVAARAVEIERARAFVVPLSSGVSSGLSQWPFFAQLLADGYPVDGSGRVAIEDLPQHGEVGVVVRHPLAPLMAPEVVELSEQPARALVRMSFASRTHQGGVVDDAGAPIAGASLWARVPGQRLDGPRSQRLLPPYLDLRGACAARAGADGRFSIGLPDAEDAQLAVRARGFAGRNVPWSSEMDAELVLPVWRGGDASLRVQPPVAGAVWRVDSNLGGGVDLPCAADEACVLALPYCGRFDVQLRVEVAGAEPVVREVTGLLVTGPVELTTDGG
ncbi:MAG: hypothetical protein KAI24_25935, partial [Planctomycetes bacterium]|nr:hypothetical protein [Planctomycetota bacterium]